MYNGLWEGVTTYMRTLDNEFPIIPGIFSHYKEPPEGMVSQRCNDCFNANPLFFDKEISGVENWENFVDFFYLWVFLYSGIFWAFFEKRRFYISAFFSDVYIFEAIYPLWLYLSVNLIVIITSKAFISYAFQIW